MTDEDAIQQLMFRRNRIEELIAIQKDEHHKNLLRAEQFYVDALIDFRRAHGNPRPILK